MRELARTPADAPEDVVRLGDKTTVIVTEVDREQRRLVLSRRQATLDR
ncbi:S1 RNA-binding domain-containing protein [Streptomyces hundungensis]